MPPGVGVLPIMTYKGRVCLRQDERVGPVLLLVELYKRVGESSFWSVKGLKQTDPGAGSPGGTSPYKTLLSTPQIMHSLENSGHGKILVYSLC